MLNLLPENAVFTQNGIAFADSQIIADVFDKEHFNVLRDIEVTIEQLLETASSDNLSQVIDISESSNLRVREYDENSSEFNEMNVFIKDNFQFVEFYELNNLGLPVTRRKYNLTEDAFSLVAMGFTGVKAMKFKYEYVRQFRKLRAENEQMRQDLKYLLEKTYGVVARYALRHKKDKGLKQYREKIHQKEIPQDMWERILGYFGEEK